MTTKSKTTKAAPPKAALSTKATAPAKAAPATKATAPAKAAPLSKATAPSKTKTPIKAAAPAKAAAKATPSPKAAPPSKAKSKSASPSTVFSLYAPEAHEVYLVGDFNDWQADGLKTRRSKDGTWSKALPLKAGSYQYLFLVDGQWVADPVNPKRAKNPFGSENSVIEVV